MLRIACRLAAALILAAVAICVPACSDDDTTGPDGLMPDPLNLTVHIDPAALAEFGPMGHVLASSLDGDLLAVAVWDAAGTLTLTSEDQLDEVLVTAVGLDGTNLLTLRPVPATGEVTIMDVDYAETDGTALVTVENPPDHVGYTMAVNGMLGSSQSPLPRSLNVSVNGPVTDLYLCLNDADGPMSAGWLRSLHQDDEVTLDLAADGVLQPVVARSLTVPDLPSMPVGSTLSWRVARRYEQGSWPEIITLDQGSALAPEATVTAHLPEDMWQSDELYTQIAVQAPGTEPGYTYVLHGPWPTELPTVDRDLTVVSRTPDDMRWEWIDAQHRATCLWTIPDINTPVRWLVEGWGGPGRRMMLPQLPAEVTDPVEWLDRDSFVPATLLVEHDVSETYTLRVVKVVPAE